MKTFFVQLDCIEVYMVNAETPEDAVDIVTSGDLDPFEIEYSGQALVTEDNRTIQ